MRRTNQTGFTLPEVLLALWLIGSSFVLVVSISTIVEKARRRSVLFSAMLSIDSRLSRAFENPTNYTAAAKNFADGLDPTAFLGPVHFDFEGVRMGSTASGSTTAFQMNGGACPPAQVSSVDQCPIESRVKIYRTGPPSDYRYQVGAEIRIRSQKDTLYVPSLYSAPYQIPIHFYAMASGTSSIVRCLPAQSMQTLGMFSMTGTNAQCIYYNQNSSCTQGMYPKGLKIEDANVLLQNGTTVAAKKVVLDCQTIPSITCPKPYVANRLLAVKPPVIGLVEESGGVFYAKNACTFPYSSPVDAVVHASVNAALASSYNRQVVWPVCPKFFTFQDGGLGVSEWKNILSLRDSTTGGACVPKEDSDWAKICRVVNNGDPTEHRTLECDLNFIKSATNPLPLTCTQGGVVTDIIASKGAISRIQFLSGNKLCRARDLNGDLVPDKIVDGIYDPVPPAPLVPLGGP